MSLLRSGPLPDAELLIEAGEHYLRPPVMGDYKTWASLRQDSRSFLTPWEPLWPSDDLTKAGFRRRLRRYSRDRKEGRSLTFLLFRSKTDEVLGGLTLSNIRRGVSQSTTLGYWMGERFAGRGHMSAAVAMILPFCFDVLRLHRIEAACLPNNMPSIRLLENAGFKREGYARNYLLINGTWQDHLLFACLAEDNALRPQRIEPNVEGILKEFL
ncbi:N-acetyltransferase [Roseibium denhamense]|uniref:[SSU ribosomal protein S5P]-alanine acetyltransferase n=1 Tax=Roseibium denhamense TaxID=76305 RepID=A0ABY1P374_9HYPH|nr:GNAT family protein [Roseibium denhamense]MTI07731.1 N-acetyltransferase [Roseibium denhamense]SMP24928.1 [SSU ribosomal protein S5P]-alanine acetyltransferase [Roseibium denhamense]